MANELMDLAIEYEPINLVQVRHDQRRAAALLNTSHTLDPLLLPFKKLGNSYKQIRKKKNDTILSKAISRDKSPNVTTKSKDYFSGSINSNFEVLDKGENSLKNSPYSQFQELKGKNSTIKTRNFSKYEFPLDSDSNSLADSNTKRNTSDLYRSDKQRKDQKLFNSRISPGGLIQHENYNANKNSVESNHLGLDLKTFAAGSKPPGLNKKRHEQVGLAGPSTLDIGLLNTKEQRHLILPNIIKQSDKTGKRDNSKQKLNRQYKLAVIAKSTGKKQFDRLMTTEQNPVELAFDEDLVVKTLKREKQNETAEQVDLLLRVDWNAIRKNARKRAIESMRNVNRKLKEPNRSNDSIKRTDSVLSSTSLAKHRLEKDREMHVNQTFPSQNGLNTKVRFPPLNIENKNRQVVSSIQDNCSFIEKDTETITRITETVESTTVAKKGGKSKKEVRFSTLPNLSTLKNEKEIENSLIELESGDRSEDIEKQSIAATHKDGSENLAQLSRNHPKMNALNDPMSAWRNAYIDALSKAQMGKFSSEYWGSHLSKAYSFSYFEPLQKKEGKRFNKASRRKKNEMRNIFGKVKPFESFKFDI